MKKTILLLAAFVGYLNTSAQGPTSSYYFNNGSVADASSNAHGTVYGAIPVADRFGNDYKAFLFNGVSDYILIPNHASNDLNNLSGISISAWYRQDAVSGSLSSIASKWNGGTSEQYGLFKSGDETFVAVRSVNNNGISDAFSPSAGWHHVVFTFDKATSKHNVYVDGVNTLIDYTPGGAYFISGDTTSLSIGAQASDLNGGTPSPTRFFNGAIDDVLIYDRVLSASEVDSLFTADSPQCQGIDIAIKSTTASSSTDGSFTFNLTGGLAPYSYTLNGGSVIPIASNIVCNNVSEGNTLTVSTPGSNQYFTNVNFASYGNPSNSCGGFLYNACHAANSQQVAMDSLIGKSTGSIICSNSTFGDPCFGTGKNFRLQVSYAEDQQINGLSAGSHSLTIMDSYGCSETFIINVPSINAGINQNELNDIKLYPNPTTDLLNISTSFSGNVDIRNVLGSTIKTIKLNTGITTIDVSELNTNIYLIVNEEKGIYQKFVKN